MERVSAVPEVLVAPAAMEADPYPVSERSATEAPRARAEEEEEEETWGRSLASSW